MIGGDELFQLERLLDDLASEKPEIVKEFYEVLKSIYDAPSYQAWLEADSPMVARYQLDTLFGTKLSWDMRRLLDSTGLINGSALEVKIDEHLGRIHLTDGPWVPVGFRVYSYADESVLICNYVKEQGYDREAEILIDPASGCGHHGLGLSHIPIRAYYDVNPRAAVYCRINSILAQAQEMPSGINDIRDGMPKLLERLSSKSVLVTINMPFGIFPKAQALPATLAQDGGDRGVHYTFAALDAVKQWADNAPAIGSLRLVLLFYSLGNDSGWEVVDRARKVFERDVQTTIFTEEKMWRVNGLKREPNPMPLDRLATKAYCLHTYSVRDREMVENGYRQLAQFYKNAGYDRLGYGLLDVLVKG